MTGLFATESKYTPPIPWYEQWNKNKHCDNENKEADNILCVNDANVEIQRENIHKIF